jgi:hypothetical protein
MSDIQLTLLFPYIPFLILVIAFALVELITDSNDEDDDMGSGGMLIPTQNPI